MPMWKTDKLLHPATAIASVALFVSLGGVTYAAATIGTSQIKNDAVTRAKIANRAVAAQQLAPNAVTGSRIAQGTISGESLAPGVAVSGEGAMEMAGTQVPSGQTRSVLGMPYLFPGQLQASCVNGIATVSYIAAPGVSVVVSGVNAGTPATPFVQAGTLANGTSLAAPAAGAGGVQSSTWQMSQGATGGSTNGATAWATTVASGTSCIVTAQVLLAATAPKAQ